MDAEALRRAAADAGLSLVTAETFAAAADYPSGVRISLGGPSRRVVLGEALSAIAALVGQTPAPARFVV